MWAGTIGSVAGPILLPIGTRIVEPFRFREYGGGYLMGGVMAALAAVIVYLALRPDPLQFAEVMDGGTRSESAPLGATLKLPIVRYVISALVVGQVVMVLIMTMTPVHIRGAGSRSRWLDWLSVFIHSGCSSSLRSQDSWPTASER